MFFRFLPFLTAAIFMGLMLSSITYFNESLLWWILGVGAFVLLLLVKKESGKWRNTITPLLLIAGSLPMLALIDTYTLRYVSVFLLSFSLYIQLMVRGRLRINSGDRVALIFLQLISLLIFFLWSNLVFASFINFSEKVFPLWLMLAIIMIASFLVSRDIIWAVMRFETPKKTKRSDVYVAGTLTALLTGEMTWALAFFPFSYRSSAVVLLAFYYIIITSILFFLAKEEKKRILAKDVVIGIAAIIIILLTAKWRYL